MEKLRKHLRADHALQELLDNYNMLMPIHPKRLEEKIKSQHSDFGEFVFSVDDDFDGWGFLSMDGIKWGQTLFVVSRDHA